ncbi:MAG TPA: hypothetical protein ENN98_07950 [Desulfurivibrio alkaliphilus]|mgnify:CR=1 FL=1|uniref:Uncharacterized protein n=1 Tax=Desulfurivibrio alkaliphilus TaxID=427923 RepID=A0A7C2TH88_9BACT|nr:hypothetical protein [Desulfurivibrio alkaliphilus]
MLALLVDQIQQLACPLFRAALQTCKRKYHLWRQIRSCHDFSAAGFMAAVLGAIIDNVKVYLPDKS